MKQQVCITGANRGIGAGFARAYLQTDMGGAEASLTVDQSVASMQQVQQIPGIQQHEQSALSAVDPPAAADEDKRKQQQ
ncbi:MAG: hypothetical protein ACOCXF_05150 [bacterium]